jgi:6-phosphogluconolactonase (cycloisomerase 2 family)
MVAFRRNKNNGALTQLAGPDGCWSRGGNQGECRVAHPFNTPTDLATSPNGRNLYVVSGASDSISIFAIDRTTGALEPLAGLDGCISASGTNARCTVGANLDGPVGVAVSRDNKTVYVASSANGAVLAYARDPAGALTPLPGQAACVSADGSGGACAQGVALEGARAIVASPGGEHL